MMGARSDIGSLPSIDGRAVAPVSGVKGANTTAHSIEPSTSIGPFERILGWLGASTSHDSEV